MNKITK